MNTEIKFLIREEGYFVAKIKFKNDKGLSLLATRAIEEDNTDYPKRKDITRLQQRQISQNYQLKKFINDISEIFPNIIKDIYTSNQENIRDINVSSKFISDYDSNGIKWSLNVSFIY